MEARPRAETRREAHVPAAETRPCHSRGITGRRPPLIAILERPFAGRNSSATLPNGPSSALLHCHATCSSGPTPPDNVYRGLRGWRGWVPLRGTGRGGDGIGWRFWSGIHLFLCVSFLFPLVKLFVELVLQKPDRVCIAPDEFINRNSVDGWRTSYPLLSSVDEDRHVFPLTALLLCPFCGGQLASSFAHLFISSIPIATAHRRAARCGRACVCRRLFAAYLSLQ